MQNILLLIALPTLTLILCVALRVPWKLIALLYLLVPFIAAVMVALLLNVEVPTHPLHFAGTALAVYPLALLSLGYCPLLVGAIAWFLLRPTSIATGSNRKVLLAGGSALGAIAGLAIMMGIAWITGIETPALAMNRGATSNLSLRQFLMWWGFVGLVAGTVAGALIAFYLMPETSDAL
jgi:hypothetical protein